MLFAEKSLQVDEKEIRRTVTKELKKYKALKVAMKNKEEQLAQGVNNLFPMVNNSEKENALKYRQIDRAIENALDNVEREIITRKYLSADRIKDITIYLDMGLTKDQYYKAKKDAIFQIATALRII